MGRRKKYFTEEERKNANRVKVKEYYWRNKGDIDKKAREYYWFKKDVEKYSEQISKKEEELGREMTNDEKRQLIEEIKSSE